MADIVVHSAQTVGDAFARQYYEILQLSPELVPRFYEDMSKIGRIDTDTGLMLSTTTTKAITEKILSYGSFTADVKSVDAQKSYNGGVVVLVNGAMVNEDDSRRNFTQTFFLAPQPTGYYVLNDIFRFVNDDDPGSNEQDGGISPVTSDQEPPSTEKDHHSEQSNGEVYNSSGELPVEVVKEEFQVEEKFEEKELLAEVVEESPQESRVVVDSFAKKPVAEVVEETPQESWVVAESSAKVEGTSKKSYASVVRNDAPATMSFSIPPKSMSKIQEQQAPVLPAPKSVAVPPSSNVETVADVKSQVLEGGGHSIYVRNLPVNIAVSVVEQAFQGFGPISSYGIQVLPHRGFSREGQHASCFGFVKFETAAAAQKAIEASPIFIGGEKVGIEEKESTVRRGTVSTTSAPSKPDLPKDIIETILPQLFVVHIHGGLAIWKENSMRKFFPPSCFVGRIEKLVGSSDGVICVLGLWKQYFVVLINPLMGRYRKVWWSGDIVSPKIGFGGMGKNMKIVRIVDQLTDQVTWRKIYIYSVKDDIWRTGVRVMADGVIGDGIGVLVKNHICWLQQTFFGSQEVIRYDVVRESWDVALKLEIGNVARLGRFEGALYAIVVREAVEEVFLLKGGCWNCFLQFSPLEGDVPPPMFFPVAYRDDGCVLFACEGLGGLLDFYECREYVRRPKLVNIGVDIRSYGIEAMQGTMTKITGGLKIGRFEEYLSNTYHNPSMPLTRLRLVFFRDIEID